MHKLIDEKTKEEFYLDSELLAMVRLLSEKIISTTDAINDMHKQIETLKRVNSNLNDQLDASSLVGQN